MADNTLNEQPALMMLEPRSSYDQFVLGLVTFPHHERLHTLYDQDAIIDYLAELYAQDASEEPREEAAEYFYFNLKACSPQIIFVSRLDLERTLEHLEDSLGAP